VIQAGCNGGSWPHPAAAQPWQAARRLPPVAVAEDGGGWWFQEERWNSAAAVGSPLE